MRNLLEKFGLDGNGRVALTDVNKRIIEKNGITEEVAVVSYRKLLQEAKENNIYFEEISKKENEYGTQDLKIETEKNGEKIQITLELDKKEITHSYY